MIIAKTFCYSPAILSLPNFADLINDEEKYGNMPIDKFSLTLIDYNDSIFDNSL